MYVVYALCVVLRTYKHFNQLKKLNISHDTCSYCANISHDTCSYCVNISHDTCSYCANISHDTCSYCVNISHDTCSYCATEGLIQYLRRDLIILCITLKDKFLDKHQDI